MAQEDIDCIKTIAIHESNQDYIDNQQKMYNIKSLFIDSDLLKSKSFLGYDDRRTFVEKHSSFSNLNQ